jgi:maleamate amidohydrolase
MNSQSIDWNLEMAKVREQRRGRTRLGPGMSPAVVVVDFQVAFTEHAACGEATQLALRNTKRLLDSARRAGVPVVYVVLVVDDLEDRMLAQRLRSSLTEACLRGDPRAEISSVVPPQVGDHIVEKRCASGFYETELHDLLQRLGIDEVVLAGTSTSGCVRATAVDAAYRDYRLALVEECCDDFRTLSGEASKWDIQDRFGDVVGTDEILARFDAMVPVSVDRS